ncbi:hypothetical protein TNCV_2783721 [Trichonephila clavipes]|nr:hypothetical protein TNCV_2783721 [Trichonephila clavipes]
MKFLAHIRLPILATIYSQVYLNLDGWKISHRVLWSSAFSLSTVTRLSSPSMLEQTPVEERSNICRLTDLHPRRVRMTT